MKKTWKLCAFGVKAEKMRIERGMPKTELCRRLGISVTYYDFIIHGMRPGIKMQPKILKALAMDKQKTA